MHKKITSALVSVYHKDRMDEIVSRLVRYGIKIFSTGGTYDFIRSLGAEAETVESLTGYPGVFGGRVKTLHPKVFGGILYRRGERSDLEQAREFDIPAIDLVIVDLYPFERTVASGASEEEVIEKIDIGGISLIRAAAKNFKDTIVLIDDKDYPPVIAAIEGDGEVSLELRKRLAPPSPVSLPDQPEELLRWFADSYLPYRLWQSAYAEYDFPETLWPDFDRRSLAACVDDYQRRERRFGGVRPE